MDDDITCRNITTRAQREIFLIEQTRPEARCNLWFYKLVHGVLDLKVLANAIKHLTSRVPLLQTRFVYSDGELWQIQDRNIQYNPKTIDVTTYPKPFEEALTRMKNAANQSGGMTADNLCEFTFYIIGINKVILYTRLHHSIIDVRSFSKLESLIATTYNDLKKCGEIAVQPKFNFDSLALADAAYSTSAEYDEDKKFWQAYVQPLKRFAYTQRSVNSVGKKTTYRQTMTLGINERQKLQHAAAAMNISESFLYIGASALLLRRLLDREHVSLSLPVRGTYLTHELGMTSNVLPLLLHIPRHATIHEVILQIAEETKSILKHQRYRVEDILKLANYSSNGSFGPVINILRYDHGETFEDCSCSTHFGGNTYTSDLHIRFWADDRNGRIDILFDDGYEGHSAEQLAALQHHLAFIIDQVVRVQNSTVATLDEQCSDVTTVELRESFYANRRKPIAAGFLQWSRCCDFLIRLVHSNTWLGNGASPFAVTKVFLGDKAVSIGKFEHIPDFVCAETPGTVLAIDENAWHVAAADGVVKISNFSGEFGQLISAQTLANQCHILKGVQLPTITSEQAEWLVRAHDTAMLAEPYWSQHLANFEPCQLSFVQNTVTQSPAWAATNYQTSGDFSAIEVLAAWLIYIARDTQMSKIQIGWDATEYWYQENEVSLNSIFARTVPFGTSINLNDTFTDVVANVEEDYKQLVNHLPCLSDTVIRYAENLTNDLSGKSPWEVAVSLSDMQNERQYATADAYKHASHGNLLTLLINRQNGDFHWIYDSSRMSEEEMDRISSRLFVLLASAHSDDKIKQSVAKLDLLPKVERDLLLFKWNQTKKTNTPARCLHQLFEAQVERDGQAIAVECNGDVLTYAELNAQANRLAHHLIARGVKPDDRIALCVERSIAMLVAMLGILKAGGAYVPLDPVYSSKRLTHVIKDTDPTFLLADASGRRALGDHQVPVVDLDTPLPDDLPVGNPDANKLGVNSTHLAYVIYTSGSTGAPKGVMVEHQQVVRLFEVTREHFGFNKEDKWCLFHSFSFDVSVWEMWGALCYGCQLSIASYDITRSTDEFYDWICTREITVLNQTPSAFKMLMLAENIISRSDRLRYVLFGGETLDPSIVRGWKRTYGESRIVLANLYGPTETVVNAIVWICDHTKSENFPIVPIGRPLPNKRIYLLDSYGEPVPLGAEGELYIGGAGVARGYLNRPELTAERFLSDPFSDNPAARMYRTGDRARYLPDGNLVYLGRADQQVKIRGFRIELGEIEAHLVEHPQVCEAVVQPQGSGSDARLVAYVVTDTDRLIAQDLRIYLSVLLPDYMVPSAYMCLPSLPLTPNGKLDRRALPAPDDDAFARQQYEAPQGETEEKLAVIWRALLGIERISRHDNFFELGGHSLLVMHFINKAKLCNLHIDARGVFSFPILKDLSEQITNRSNRLYSDTAIPVRQYGNETPLFLLPDGWGDISYAFELAHDIDRNIPVYALPWPSPENKQPSSIEEMAHAMISLMKKVQANGPYAIAGYSGGGILGYEMAKQLIKSGCRVSFLGLIDTYPPIANPLTEMETFLSYFVFKFPVIENHLKNNSNWWSRVTQLTLIEGIEEIKKINIALKNMDFEWEALLSKQRHNYQNICASVKIDSLPIKTHLFKATSYRSFSAIADLFHKSNRNNFVERFDSPKLGWEKYDLSADFNIIAVDGDHQSIMTDPKNRSLLGKEINISTKLTKKNH